MGKFNVDEALKPIRRLMLLIGAWPSPSPSIGYKIREFLVISATITFIITVLIKTISDFENLPKLSIGICYSVAGFQGVIKYCILFLNKSKFAAIINCLKSPLLTIHEDCNDVYLEKKVYISQACTKILLTASMTTALLTAVTPLLEASTSRPLPVPFPIDMDDQSLSVYCLVYFFQSIATPIIGVSLLCFDGIVFTFLSIAAGHLKIVREKIVLSVKFATDTSEEDCDKKVNRALKECVDQYLLIESYVKLLEETFTVGFLLQLLVSLVEACFTEFNFILLPIKSVDFARCLFFFTSMLMELAFFCIPGNEIIRQSEQIKDACYMSEWINCGPSVQKNLLIIMERSKRPLKLSAENFVDLSLRTFVGVLNSAFTYFSVLRQLYLTAKQK